MAGVDLLPGDFILAARVSDYDLTSETEEYIGSIKEDITVSGDYETAESNLKEERTTIRDRTHRSIDLEMVIAESESTDPLSVMGIDTTDNTTDSLEGDQMECLRLYIYTDEPPSTGDSNASKVKEYFQVQGAIDENAHPTGDHITYSVTAFVNNGWKTGKGGGSIS